ncbi:MAG: 50S ribosomal protein L25 [Chloroflexota bacterium]
MSTLELRAEPRSIVGKKVRFLRRQGVVPANVFGQSTSTPVQLPVREVEQTIRRAGRNQLISLVVAGGETSTVLVKDWQRHPYKGDLLHVDFFRVAMTETMRLDVPIRLTGEAPAVKLTGGTPFQTLATVSVECLPSDIPEGIEVDVSELAENDASIFVRDLTVPSGVTILTDGDEMVVKIMAPRVAQTAAEEEGGEAPVAEAAGGTEAESSEESGES